MIVDFLNSNSIRGTVLTVGIYVNPDDVNENINIINVRNLHSSNQLNLVGVGIQYVFFTKDSFLDVNKETLLWLLTRIRYPEYDDTRSKIAIVRNDIGYITWL